MIIFRALQHDACSCAIHLYIRQLIRSIMACNMCEHVHAGREVPVSERHRGK